MKEREIYTGIKTLAPVIIRLDGRSFHQFLGQLSLKRPFDEDFSQAMVQVCSLLLTESGLSPLFAYTFSDEISLYLDELPFEGRVEKLTSVIASFAASALTIVMKVSSPISFDARIIPVEQEMVATYLTWRQKEAWRNHVNGYSQTILMQDGLDRVEVQRRLNGIGSRQLHEICFQHGVNLAHTPAWERRGIMVYHTHITKPGFNPITKEKTEAIRRKLHVDRDLPLFSSEEGRIFVDRICSGL
ncbi:MAG: tRNA 5'-guanylyltransferase [Methanospirillum sp.]|uniref:tRNA(His) guanylyltransferase Thg1 family protein n=1 Tax=Methanospirillum sp. TaxID=45200 RepID=UPI0023733F24|nr:tRNA(His) guanylyltransferase Thg1 family protein [Methanospirillum sp.]MDD1728130.1 tRNA 5'-guanylyltransferase [Methanospirillum sp.]